jgi:hypothetical protein
MPLRAGLDECCRGSPGFRPRWHWRDTSRLSCARNTRPAAAVRSLAAAHASAQKRSQAPTPARVVTDLGTRAVVRPWSGDEASMSGSGCRRHEGAAATAGRADRPRAGTTSRRTTRRIATGGVGRDRDRIDFRVPVPTPERQRPTATDHATAATPAGRPDDKGASDETI